MRHAIVLHEALPIVKTESELTAINERLSLALQSSNQIAFDWHINDDTLVFSDSLNEDLTGLLLDSTSVWSASTFPSLIHDDDLSNFDLRLHEALKVQAGRPDAHYQVELRLKDSMRMWRWINIMARVTERDSDGRAVRMTGTFSDIDERKCAEKQAERLRRMYAMLSRTSQTIIRIRDCNLLFQEVCRIAVDHGHFTAAWIELISDDGEQDRVIAAHGQEYEHPSRHPFPCTTSVSTNGQHQHDNNQQADASHSIGRYTFSLHGVPHGVLNLKAPECDYFTDPISEVLDNLANDISFAINNIERQAFRTVRETALMESENLNSTILTHAIDCIVSLDQNGEILSFNKAAELTFGLRSNSVLGKKLADVIVAPQWREHDGKEIRNFLTSVDSPALNRRVELNGMRSDGSTFPIELAVVPIQLNDQAVFTVFIRDISEYKRSEAELKKRAATYRQLLERSPQATFVCQHNRIVLANQAACRLLGAIRPADLLGRDILEFICADDQAFITEHDLPSSDHREPAHFAEQAWYRIGGQRFNAEVGATGLIHNSTPSVQLVVRDITERKRAEAIQVGQNRILNLVATGSSLNKILEEIARFVEDSSNGMLCAIHRQEADDTPPSEYCTTNVKQGRLSILRNRNFNLNKRINLAPSLCAAPIIASHIVESPDVESGHNLTLPVGLEPCVSRPIVGTTRKVLGTIALHSRENRRATDAELEVLRICADLAGIAIESRASEERIRYLAHYDGLTSLPNRFLFEEYLELALRNAQRNRKKFAVLFLDLDRFKEINDTLGHDAGDLVLREIARRMRNCLRHNDKIARMGGDEFYVLLEDMVDGVDAAEVAQKLLDEASRPINIGGHTCHLSVSIGISIYPDDGNDAHTLIANADKAMYCAKEQGKNAFYFISSRDASVKPSLPLLRAVRMASKAHLRLV